jgi:hypothetical protein
MSPLNPRLFAALQSLYGRVLVANEGEASHVEYEPDPDCPGGVRARTLYRGEEYRLDCPWCSDTRGRLYVNHRYGVYDRAACTGNYHLLYCFNEGCHQGPANRREFQARVSSALLRRGRGPLLRPQAKPAPAPKDRPPVALPEGFEPVHELPRSHPAVSYLLGRDFDPAELGRRWGVSYARSCPTCRPAVYERLVIPVYQPTADPGGPANEAGPGELWGWQARAIRPLPPQAPKYLFAAGMPKSRLLYGLPLALRTRGPLCVCEGATDCWRLGGNAVALFGKAMSRGQAGLLLRHFAGRPLVLCLDRDAAAESAGARDALKAARTQCGDTTPVVVAELPQGRKDVGECGRAEAWEAVRRTLREMKYGSDGTSGAAACGPAGLNEQGGAL